MTTDVGLRGACMRLSVLVAALPLFFSESW